MSGYQQGITRASEYILCCCHPVVQSSSHSHGENVMLIICQALSCHISHSRRTMTKPWMTHLLVMVCTRSPIGQS
jgi:hypothetical protein